MAIKTKLIKLFLFIISMALLLAPANNVNAELTYNPYPECAAEECTEKELCEQRNWEPIYSGIAPDQNSTKSNNPKEDCSKYDSFSTKITNAYNKFVEDNPYFVAYIIYAIAFAPIIVIFLIIKRRRNKK